MTLACNIVIRPIFICSEIKDKLPTPDLIFASGTKHFMFPVIVRKNSLETAQVFYCYWGIWTF